MPSLGITQANAASSAAKTQAGAAKYAWDILGLYRARPAD